jgi:hypothetical protein
MLPVHLRHHRVTAKGREFKVVTCENCRGEYVYLMVRHAEGWAAGVTFLDADAPGRAARQAETELRRTLDRDGEPVPCPSCGWYQHSMISLVRGHHRFWMAAVGSLLLYVGGLLGLVGAAGWACYADPAAARGWASIFQAGCWIAVAGGGLVLARRILAAGIDPNDGDAERRLELGRRLALPRAEFDRLAADAGATAAEPARAPDRGGEK